MNKLTKRARLNNIEIRPISLDSEYAFEVVKWYPNDLYGKISDYEPKTEGSDMYILKRGTNQVSFHKDMFSLKELCYVIAFITRSKEPDVMSVGDRPWCLSEQDRVDFDILIKEFFNTKQQTDHEL